MIIQEQNIKQEIKHVYWNNLDFLFTCIDLLPVNKYASMVKFAY